MIAPVIGSEACNSITQCLVKVPGPLAAAAALAAAVAIWNLGSCYIAYTGAI